ncbi:MAG: hypothetical protein CM1200mP29_03620 [Verrucomicrobiota bacterium]|nr:MAG: hypothetical protein CM1200mP29_03620 [Verrucomicrobiota bacterium]
MEVAGTGRPRAQWPRSTYNGLRSVDPVTRQLIAQTDVRSTKVPGFRKDPRVAWHFFDPQTKVQVRANGRVTVHHDDEVTRTAWAAVPGAQQAQLRHAKRSRLAVDDPSLGQAKPVPTLLPMQISPCSCRNHVYRLATTRQRTSSTRAIHVDRQRLARRVGRALMAAASCHFGGLADTSVVSESITQLTNELIASYAKGGGINHLEGATCRPSLPSRRSPPTCCGYCCRFFL